MKTPAIFLKSSPALFDASSDNLSAVCWLRGATFFKPKECRMYWVFRVLAFSALTAACCNAAEAESLVIVAAEIPPMVVQQDALGTVSGPLAGAVLSAIVAAGYVPKARMYPLARAWDMARYNENTCFLIGTPTSERRAHYQWVGPILRRNLVLYATPGSTAKFSSLAEASAHRIGAENGSAVAELLRAQNINPDIAPNAESSIKKLMLGRIELWAALDMFAVLAAKNLGVPPLHETMVLGSWDGYMACSLKVSPVIIANLQKAVVAARAKGVFKEFDRPTKD